MPIIIVILVVLAIWLLSVVLKVIWAAMLCTAVVTVIVYAARQTFPTHMRVNLWIVALPVFLISLFLLHLGDVRRQDQLTTVQTTADAARKAQERAKAQALKHKAVASEKGAAKIVGGFSNDETRLYHAGLQHIANEHQKLGSFTIAQVVDGERSREQQRQADREAAKQRVAQAAERIRQEEESHYLHGSPECLVIDRRTVDATASEYASYVVGKVQNTCARDFGYVQVQVAFYDANGNLADSGLANVNNLSAGETWSFKVIDINSESHKTYRVNKVSGF